MVGDCITRPPDLSPTARSKSAFRASSNFIKLLLVLLTACAGTDQVNREYAGSIVDEKIINVRLVQSVGPSVGYRRKSTG